VTLLPCPFCGGSALGVDHPPHKHYFVPMPDHPGSYTIECAACNVGLIDDTKEKAEAAWNKRVPYVNTPPISGVKLVKMFKDQRDEVAEVLRGCLSWLSSYPGGGALKAYDRARAVLDNCPSYDRQLQNLCDGLGITREQLEGALVALASPPISGGE
jgi:hypothetical protein